MRLCQLLFAAAVLSLGFAPAPFPKARPRSEVPDLDRMQGTWQVVERYFTGGWILDEPAQVRIKGNRLEYVVLGKVRSEWIFELSPAESPRRMDRRSVEYGTVFLGIYRFDGDDLILCHSPRRVRPTQFDSRPGNYLMTLRRAGR